MTIIFETEEDSTFAISQKEVYKNKVCDELMWAEIEKKDNVFNVRWEDDFMKKIAFSSEELAKSHILRDHLLHTPFINGAAFDLNDYQ